MAVKAKFEESNQKMTNLVNDIKNNHMNDFSGNGPDIYINSLSSYSQNLKKMNSVLEVLGNSTLKSAIILKETQENVAKKLYYASISSTAQGALSNNFINQDKINIDSFSNVKFENSGDGTYKIISQDGTAIGFTNEAGKAAYEGRIAENVSNVESSIPTSQIQDINTTNVESTPSSSQAQEVNQINSTPTTLQHQYISNDKFTLTTDNPTYNLSDEDFKQVAATMYAEAKRGNYDDNLGVASTIAYRVESGEFGCSTLKEVISQPGQFVGYQNKNYDAFIKAYESNSLTDEMKVSVDVLKDMTNGVRNHTQYGYFTSGNSNIIVEGGNGYKNTWK